MKKVFLIFMAFLVCLACFNSMVGANNRKYGETVHAVVKVVNKVGDISTSVFDFFEFEVNEYDVLPIGYYQWYDLYKKTLKFSGHSDSCLKSYFDYFLNRYYSDVKIYYLQLGSKKFNNEFESQGLEWIGSFLRPARPELVEDIYTKALEDGYPMDNPWVGEYADNMDFYPYTCNCEVK